MMLAGFTGLGLGAASLALASIPDVAGAIYGCYRDTSVIDPQGQALSQSPTTVRTSNFEKGSTDNARP
jgi:hypothetical protein